MDNLEDEEAMQLLRDRRRPLRPVLLEGVGLHGAFWHRGFGHVRSHGCVNLAPLDAQRLFAFTSPHLPAGWTAVLPTATKKARWFASAEPPRRNRRQGEEPKISDLGVLGALAVRPSSSARSLMLL